MSLKDLEHYLERVDPSWGHFEDIMNIVNNSEVTLEWIRNYFIKWVDDNFKRDDVHDNYLRFNFLLRLVEDHHKLFTEDFVDNFIFKKLFNEGFLDRDDISTLVDYILMFVPLSEEFLEKYFRIFDNDFNLVVLLSHQNFSEEFFIKHIESIIGYHKSVYHHMHDLVKCLESNDSLDEEVKSVCKSLVIIREGL